MKKLFFVIVATMAAYVSNAQVDTTSAAGDQSQYKTDERADFSDKEVIPVSELPALVQEQLKSPDFAGWTVVNAYKKEKSGKLWYAVEMKNANETKWLNSMHRAMLLKKRRRSSSSEFCFHKMPPLVEAFLFKSGWKYDRFIANMTAYKVKQNVLS
jgi:hypothetical protein